MPVVYTSYFVKINENTVYFRSLCFGSRNFVRTYVLLHTSRSRQHSRRAVSDTLRVYNLVLVAFGGARARALECVIVVVVVGSHSHAQVCRTAFIIIKTQNYTALPNQSTSTVLLVVGSYIARHPAVASSPRPFSPGRRVAAVQITFSYSVCARRSRTIIITTALDPEKPHADNTWRRRRRSESTVITNTCAVPSAADIVPFVTIVIVMWGGNFMILYNRHQQ